MVLPFLGGLRRAGTHAGDDAALVYPQEPLGMTGLQRLDG
jgi:hypothetical protein